MDMGRYHMILRLHVMVLYAILPFGWFNMLVPMIVTLIDLGSLPRPAAVLRRSGTDAVQLGFHGYLESAGVEYGSSGVVKGISFFYR